MEANEVSTPPCRGKRFRCRVVIFQVRGQFPPARTPCGIQQHSLGGRLRSEAPFRFVHEEIADHGRVALEGGQLGGVFPELPPPMRMPDIGKIAEHLRLIGKVSLQG